MEDIQDVAGTYKVDNLMECNDCRQITILLVLYKVYKHLVLSKMIEHNNQHSIIIISWEDILLQKRTFNNNSNVVLHRQILQAM